MEASAASEAWDSAPPLVGYAGRPAPPHHYALRGLSQLCAASYHALRYPRRRQLQAAWRMERAPSIGAPDGAECGRGRAPSGAARPCAEQRSACCTSCRSQLPAPFAGASSRELRAIRGCPLQPARAPWLVSAREELVVAALAVDSQRGMASGLAALASALRVDAPTLAVRCLRSGAGR